jgi:small subunit ribosomal protein S4
MGDPRRLKKKYRPPTNPFEKLRIAEEFKYVGDYGLRNKTELWKHRSKLSHYRQLAREFRALPENLQKPRIEGLRKSLQSLGLVGATAGIDEILGLTIENLLDRRLQTYIYKVGMAKTLYQARQLVTHGHIYVNGKIIDSPSYIVRKEEETKLEFAPNSPFKIDPTKLNPKIQPKPERGGKYSKKVATEESAEVSENEEVLDEKTED